MKKRIESREPEIIYSRSVKAGRRIYYLDVKKARNEDLYVCITESKKQSREEETPVFEKHKLFLYKEDFNRFQEGLEDVIGYIRQQLGEFEDRPDWTPEDTNNAEAAKDAAEVSENENKSKRGLFGLFGK